MSVTIGNKTEQKIAALSDFEESEDLYSALDVLLILALAFHLLGTGNGIREAAKRLRGKCNASGMYTVRLVLNVKDPMAMIRTCLRTLEF